MGLFAHYGVKVVKSNNVKPFNKKKLNKRELDDYMINNNTGVSNYEL